jgi:hypothetical protein
MTHLRKYRSWSIGFLVLLAALFLGVTTPALAQDNPARPTPNGANLELFYAREQLAADRQAEALRRAGEAVTRVEALIARFQGEGFDTADLETALAAYRTGIAAAQSAHDEAAAILNTHAGFDADGHVTDFAQALDTVRTAGQSLREAHLKLRTANLDLRQALRAWRDAHRPA